MRTVTRGETAAVKFVLTPSLHLGRHGVPSAPSLLLHGPRPVCAGGPADRLFRRQCLYGQPWAAGALTAELGQAKAERDQWQRRVSLIKSESLDPDMLDERVRALLDYADPRDAILIVKRR